MTNVTPVAPWAKVPGLLRVARARIKDTDRAVFTDSKPRRLRKLGHRLLADDASLVVHLHASNGGYRLVVTRASQSVHVGWEDEGLQPVPRE